MGFDYCENCGGYRERRNPEHLGSIRDSEMRLWDKVRRFQELANLQRGAPEEAMGRIQDAAGGGLLSYIVEHAGDLTHRMAKSPLYNRGGFREVKEKVDKIYPDLQTYSFSKMYKNIENNAHYHRENVRHKLLDVEERLLDYANEHRRLPVYNEAQRNARDLAVAIGEQRWNDARELIADLKYHTDQGRDHWEEYAMRDHL